MGSLFKTWSLRKREECVLSFRGHFSALQSTLYTVVLSTIRLLEKGVKRQASLGIFVLCMFSTQMLFLSLHNHKHSSPWSYNQNLVKCSPLILPEMLNAICFARRGLIRLSNPMVFPAIVLPLPRSFRWSSAGKFHCFHMLIPLTESLMFSICDVLTPSVAEHARRNVTFGAWWLLVHLSLDLFDNDGSR